MLYTLLILLFTALLLAIVSSYAILRAAISDRPMRRVLMFFVLITPPIALFVFIKSLFVRPKPVRYNREIGRIEDEIEAERVRTFGGKVMRPSFSERWKNSYLYAVEKSAAAAVKIDPSLSNSLCGLGNLH